MRDEITRLSDQIAGLETLIGKYWMLAYNEGKEGRDHDTENGDAQRVWHEIQAELRALARTDHPEDKLRMVAASRARVSEIEDAVASGAMNAMQCFTQMRQLIVKPDHSAGVWRVVVGKPTIDRMVDLYVSAVNAELARLTPRDWEIERFNPEKSVRRVAEIGITAAIAALAQPAGATDGEKCS